MLQLNIPHDDVGEMHPPTEDPSFEIKDLHDYLKYI
jgi:hypothetical protein